jgi:ribosome-binding factor A
MSIKQDRMMERIREILSSLLLMEVTDPALSGVTITDVVLDRELEYANVYVNALGDDTRQPEVMAGLKRANGFMRYELGKRLRLRRVPYLNFHWDITFTRAEHIEKAIDKVKVKPAEIQPSQADSNEGNQDEHDSQ